MARHHSALSLEILKTIATQPERKVELFYHQFKKQHSKKVIYNTIYRLVNMGLLEPTTREGEVALIITRSGEKLLAQAFPKKDGIWKLIIYDIPEKKRFVRNVLRARLTQIGFKKWQSSIWASPYALDPDIEAELTELAKKFFIRLIRTTDINETSDLEKLFKE